MRAGVSRRRAERALVFAEAAARFWLEIFPLARRELRYWRARAAAIPDPVLRGHALFTHRTKARHAEGLAAFAVLSPGAHRGRVVRGAVAFESILDYLDTVSEQPADDSLANSRQLHRAFDAAVDLGSQPPDDFYALQANRDDGGYLADLAAACREVLGSLPSYEVVGEALRRRAAFCGETQSRYHAIPHGLDEAAVASWATEAAAAIGLERETEWWEIAAAGSSSLPIGALMAAAADPTTSPEDAARIEGVYFPWIGALTSLLDCLTDLATDEPVSSTLARYPSQAVATEHLVEIASHSLRLCSGLPRAELHEAILAGAGGYYLAQSAAWQPGWERSVLSILDALGEFGRPALVVHCLRQKRPRAGLRAAVGGTAA